MGHKERSLAILENCLQKLNVMSDQEVAERLVEIRDTKTFDDYCDFFMVYIGSSSQGRSVYTYECKDEDLNEDTFCLAS